MKLRQRWIAIGTAGLAAALVVSIALAYALGWLRPPTPRATTPMSQSIYVWQRAWGDPVRRAVVDHASAADGGLIALAAEVAWKDGVSSTAVVALDHAALAASKVPIGLALRIGPCPTKLLRDPGTIAMLTSIARAAVASARAGGCEPRELQIDFDSATARLDDYRRWIETIAAEVKPMPVTITVLPSWMSSSAFGPLVAASAGFVLQVHSVEKARIESAAPTLCDSASAVRWTEQASRYGVPFLVALPTYGYLAMMDDAGKLTGLIAESDASALETGSRVREVSASPSAIAELVANWMDARPQAMRGVIWYRMPVDGDRLNWSWPTLARVMRGAVPIGQLVLRCEESSAGLFELVAANDGDADATLPKSLLAQWSADVALVGADGLAGMEWSRKSANQAAFARVIEGPDARIRPGERRVIGWIRLDKHTEVSVHAVEEP